ncbi:MAG: hypothetical protein AAB401_00025 [Acidobacteriota bacterium]
MSNENTNNEYIIEDLSAENADEIKGGPSTQSKRTLILKSTVAGEADGETAAFNHNETVREDDEVEAQTLVDLPVDEATEAELIGGPTSVQWPYEFKNTPGNVLNHNETVSQDNEAQEATTENLTDLSVDENAQEEVKGGLLLPAVQKVREAAARI